MPGVKEMADEAAGRAGKKEAVPGIKEEFPGKEIEEAMPGTEEALPGKEIEEAMESDTDLPPEITPEEDALQAKETLQDMAVGIAACAVLMAIIGSLIIHGSRVTFCLGILLGAGTAGLMLWHMYVTIGNALDMDADSAVKYTKRSATLRILMAGAAFVAGAFLPRVFHLIGVLLGTLCLKFSAYLQPLTHKALKNFRKGR